MSTYVSIGSNIGDKPMPKACWEAFCRDVEVLVSDRAGPVVSAAAGSGRYNGSMETIFVVVGAGTPEGLTRRAFEEELADLTNKYEQDAIAVAYAPVKFIEPKSTRGDRLIDKARTEYNRAEAEYGRAEAEYNRAGAEYNRTRAEYNRTGAERNRAGAE